MLSNFACTECSDLFRASAAWAWLCQNRHVPRKAPAVPPQPTRTWVSSKVEPVMPSFVQTIEIYRMMFPFFLSISYVAISPDSSNPVLCASNLSKRCRSRDRGISMNIIYLDLPGCAQNWHERSSWKRTRGQSSQVLSRQDLCGIQCRIVFPHYIII